MSRQHIGWSKCNPELSAQLFQEQKVAPTSSESPVSRTAGAKAVFSPEASSGNVAHASTPRMNMPAHAISDLTGLTSIPKGGGAVLIIITITAALIELWSSMNSTYKRVTLGSLAVLFLALFIGGAVFAFYHSNPKEDSSKEVAENIPYRGASDKGNNSLDGVEHDEKINAKGPWNTKNRSDREREDANRSESIFSHRATHSGDGEHPSHPDSRTAGNSPWDRTERQPDNRYPNTQSDIEIPKNVDSHDQPGYNGTLNRIIGTTTAKQPPFATHDIATVAGANLGDDRHQPKPAKEPGVAVGFENFNHFPEPPKVEEAKFDIPVYIPSDSVASPSNAPANSNQNNFSNNTATIPGESAAVIESQPIFGAFGASGNPQSTDRSGNRVSRTPNNTGFPPVVESDGTFRNFTEQRGEIPPPPPAPVVRDNVWNQHPISEESGYGRGPAPEFRVQDRPESPPAAVTWQYPPAPKDAFQREAVPAAPTEPAPRANFPESQSDYRYDPNRDATPPAPVPFPDASRYANQPGQGRMQPQPPMRDVNRMEQPSVRPNEMELNYPEGTQQYQPAARSYPPVDPNADRFQPNRETRIPDQQVYNRNQDRRNIAYPAAADSARPAPERAAYQPPYQRNDDYYYEGTLEHTSRPSDERYR